MRTAMGSGLTSEFVKQALSQTVWDLGNQVLYDLCAANPGHKQDDIIIAKVWLIGRSYAAAIERSSKTAAFGDAVYEWKVAPIIRSSTIDCWFQALVSPSDNDVALRLETHKRIMKLFAEISGKGNRSLASKYLHFHFPNHFYLYDTRASNAISELTEPIRRKLPPLRDHDDGYARFYLRCLNLNQDVGSFFGRHLSPRELDKVLLAWSAKQTSKHSKRS